MPLRRPSALYPDLSDPESFRHVYESNHDGLVVLAWRVLRDGAAAEDVVQDVFLELWMSPGAFAPAGGSLRSYLRMMVRSGALDRWRSRAVAQAATERVQAEAASGEA